MIRSILPIEEIRERDIDLLLLEEIAVNGKFRNFFLASLGLNNIGAFREAYHSLTQGGLGESDLVILFEEKPNKGFLLLIENKIDANFMNRQAERYRERGEAYVKEQNCENFMTVLVSPKSYIPIDHGFDLTLTYEEIKNWFVEQKDKRSSYKALVLESAIERKRRGYQRIRNEKVTSFQHQFYNLSQSLYPDLCFRKPPQDVPKGSGFLYCEPPLLKAKKIQIVYKFLSKDSFTAIDLQLLGKANEFQKFISQYKSQLEEGMEIVKVNKSLAVRFRIPRLEITGSFEEQRNSLILAINYAKRLYDWAIKNITNKDN